MSRKVLFIVVSFVIIVSLTACAAATKTQLVSITAKESTTDSAMMSVKCALLQSGWNITYTDTESISAAKPFGWDHVPVTLNISLQKAGDNIIKARFTVNNPRGVFDNGDHYTRDVVTALKNCGAEGLVISAD